VGRLAYNYELIDRKAENQMKAASNPKANMEEGNKDILSSKAENRNHYFFNLLTGTLVFLLFAWYLSANKSYPYYHIWDMDYITALDTVLIQSDMRPGQNCHPSFGMYLILNFSEKIAHYFGVLSAINLDELGSCLNPLSAMAELTDFVRLHSPFLALAIAGFLAMSLRRIFNISSAYSLLFFAVLGIQGSLLYHSCIIRSEFYSVFFWSISLFAVSIAVKSKDGIWRVIALLLTGVLLGLTFFTKIQSIFYVLIAPLFFIQLVFLFEEDQQEERPAITGKRVFTAISVSISNLLAFIILGVISYHTSIPRGVRTWAISFGIQPIAVAFFLGFFSLVALQLFLILRNKTNSDIFRMSSYLGLIASGFLGSFLLYFLLFTDAGASARHILLHFKLALLREPRSLNNPETSDYVPNLVSFIYSNIFTIIVVFGLNLFLLIGRLRGLIKISRKQIFFCLAGTAICFFNVAFATRSNIRDILWKEMVFSFLILFLIGIILKKAVRYRPLLVKCFSVLLAVIILVNFFYARDMPRRVDAEFSTYGWQKDKWTVRIYTGNQPKYASMISNIYNSSMLKVATSQAMYYKEIRRMSEFVFNNQDITLRNIGILFDGFSVWTADRDYKIVEAPQALRAHIVVDSASAEFRKKRPYRKEYVKKHRGFIDRYQKYSTAGQISVLTRSDLGVYIFVQPSDALDLLSKKMVRTPYKITVSNKKESIELVGLEIKDYCGISLDKLRNKYFFVIYKK
jgi:hypothetical protein